MEHSVYTTLLIPSSRIDGLQKLFTRLTNKINKGKTEATIPELTVVKTVISTNPQYIIKPTEVSTKAYELMWVTIRYQAPSLAGWKLIAVYDWETTDDGERHCYTSPVPGEITPYSFRHVEDGLCDHCNTNRRRKKSMLITKDYLEYKVVGSSCIKDFLGHISPTTLMSLYSFHSEVTTYSEHYGGGDARAYYDVDYFLSVAATLIRNVGYRGSNCDYNQTPTSVMANMYLNPSSEYDYELIADYPVTDVDITTAKKTKAFIMAQSDSEDYFANLQTAVQAGSITTSRFGLLVSSVFAYNRTLERQMIEDEKVNHANKFIGNIKERINNFEVEIIKVYKRDTDYGISTMVTMLTPEGNTFVWWASKNLDVEVGQKWLVQAATVTKHDTFNKVNQTVVNRVKYIDLDDNPQSMLKFG
jgi:hypothetical protein